MPRSGAAPAPLRRRSCAARAHASLRELLSKRTGSLGGGVGATSRIAPATMDEPAAKVAAFPPRLAEVSRQAQIRSQARFPQGSRSPGVSQSLPCQISKASSDERIPIGMPHKRAMNHHADRSGPSMGPCQSHPHNSSRIPPNPKFCGSQPQGGRNNFKVEAICCCMC